MNNQEEELMSVDATYYVELANRLERLEDNEDFKALILDGYMRDKALDSVSLLANPAVKRGGERPDIMEDLVAISNLQYYFNMIKNLGTIAEDELAEDEEDEA